MCREIKNEVLLSLIRKIDDNKEILLETITLSEKVIWGGVGDEDKCREIYITNRGIIEKIVLYKYGQFQNGRGPDRMIQDIKHYSFEESINIIAKNEKYQVQIKQEVF